ncbi:MAG: FtsW/RodA/SpoVE family cell cycle protein [Bacteroidales bacterium]|nr:FtsW/RodA/SpoVE family cell cycle protein [Bacteroidales bacterium]
MKARKFKLSHVLKGDLWLWLVVILLMLISLVAVYSTIELQAVTKAYTTPWRAFVRHAAFVVVAFVEVVALANMNYRAFSKVSRLLYLISLGLLVAMMVLGGRWMAIPIIGRFQPSEIGKVVLVVYLSRQIAVNQDMLDEKPFFYQLLILVGLTAGLILRENFSTSALVIVISLVVMLIGGVNTRYVLTTMAIVGALGVAFLAYSSHAYHQQQREQAMGIYNSNNSQGMLKRATTWGHRVDSWLHPNPDELTQENMARMAVATGGFFGVGVGNTVHARLMSEADNDFIYAIIIEESGMMGGIIVLFLYGFLYMRCLRISRRCKGFFGSLVSAGLGSLIFIQALVNMAVAVGALPVTGQTLPLISRGGTAYIMMGFAIGVIQAVAYDTNKVEQADDERKQRSKEFKETVAVANESNNGASATV